MRIHLTNSRERLRIAQEAARNAGEGEQAADPSGPPPVAPAT